jgi:hypothetical protein
MYPHRIRLRGPWELKSASEAAARRVNLPARWVDLGWTTGPCSASLIRRFGLPRILDSYEREFITCSGIQGASEWTLNGELMCSWPATIAYGEFEVTGRLLQRNLLDVRIDSQSEAGGPWGEVALEIRGRHYLKNVEIIDDVAKGLVVGDSYARLELYILRQGKTVRYENVTASQTGIPFSFDVPCDQTPLNLMSRSLGWRIELVEGANRWFTVELPSG